MQVGGQFAESSSGFLKRKTQGFVKQMDSSNLNKLEKIDTNMLSVIRPSLHFTKAYCEKMQ